MLPFRLALLFLLIAASTVLHVIPLLAIALLKVVLPLPRLRAACNPLLTGLAASWIGFNNWLWDTFTRTRLSLRGDADLQLDGHYLVLANHQSWVDILVLQKVFNRRIPLLRFFLKRQLFWVPLLGLAWWALDFPFMGRYTPRQVAKNPALAGRDIEATRRACDKFRAIPVAIMNFVEGTRFTDDKHAKQGSPYRHLLKPKSGGVAFVLDAMGEGLHAILDVSIAYPAGRPSLVDLLADRVPEVRVQVRQRPIPTELVGGDYQGDREFRVRFQQWMNGLWREKDEDLAALLGATSAAPGDGRN
ncbi:acyltransferase [Thermomonas sp. XSG]|jgi:1-acyl-sn-glycerol-3-phosphate acyltransferase|uniref:acyltransferase n=1 Tax=Thermomonas sp. XSG TaxID=2771436 RepID=UPI00086DF669|nr:acyltransferase [Thermomonas sp. XSG]ODU53399.1 MAG: acyltransferase [Xanthomonadaceae bacterium SCN 69-48]QNU14041.1 acyltransferase [Thermomonas sp. XSG]